MSAEQPDRVVSSASPVRLAVSSRGDALTQYLSEALQERFPVVASIDMELSRSQRLLVAAATFRPSRRAWVERYYKSALAYRLRSRNGASQLHQLHGTVDVTFQVHALYEQLRGAHVIYVDCTHRQTAEQWPPWNPLRGMALQRWYERERLQYLRAAHLFAFSEPTRRSLVDDYGVPAARVSVVGAGVNFCELPALGARRKSSAPTVLFVGNDFVRKGGEVLLQAFAEVRRSLPNAILLVVGTRHRVADQPGVRVLGRINDRAALGRLYSEADVFALPSFYDPFPLALLEAMAYGLPCVSTATCGVPEIVEDGVTGRVVGIGDAEGLAAALLELLHNPVRARSLGRAGREQVAARCQWPLVVERMAPVLDRMGSVDPGHRADGRAPVRSPGRTPLS